jgi:hypothetical protein
MSDPILQAVKIWGQPFGGLYVAKGKTAPRNQVVNF